MTNICSEITLHTDESHSFVCCLSSLNLAKYEEWKNTNLIYDSIWFLDGVLEEFIQKSKGKVGFHNSVRSAEKGRALGLGVLGWHTYLQDQGLPFEGLLSQYETRKIFSQIKIESERASMALAEEFGELFGAVVQVLGILICGLLLLLYLTASLVATLVLESNLGLQTYLQNKVQRVLSFARTLRY